jgi:hypothetical protein
LTIWLICSNPMEEKRRTAESLSILIQLRFKLRW